MHQKSWTRRAECSSIWAYVIFSHDEYIVVCDTRLWNTVEYYKVVKMNNHYRTTYKHGKA